MLDPQASPYLQFDDICKSFPGVNALDHVSFGVRAGSVHALVGENGAGKSTLLKILSGAYTLTSGTITIDGKQQSFAGTADALAAGISVIYQELATVPHVSVAENLYLGHLPKRHGIIDYPRLWADARKLLEPLSDDIDPRIELGQLSIGQQQMVEIAKALGRGAKIIAFDEPTSSLSARDTERLFEVIRKLRDEGRVILYVSHRMEEIFHVCDSVTVFKDGRHVQTFETMEGLTRDLLITRMVGREILDIYNYVERPHGDVMLDVQGMEGPGLSGPLSLQVHAGEILGLFGLVGAGRSELLKLIFGATPRTGGKTLLEGTEVAIRSPREAIGYGMVFCPENRKVEGIIPPASVRENINISARHHFGHAFGVLNGAWEQRNAVEQVKALDVRMASLDQLIRNLSGGNQQKVILARWLSDEMKVILFDEPTRGIDVGARSEIYGLIFRLAERGVAVLMVSSDLPEVLGVADRVAVMRGGALSGFLSRSEATEEKALALALPQ
jgi:L-arabinose transport system ATP-binding protein